MIASGVKKEEYRTIKPYYTSRFMNIGLLDKAARPTDKCVWVVFRNGYSKISPTLKALCRLDVKQGNTAWGAEPDIEYYVLKITAIKNYNNTGGMTRYKPNIDFDKCKSCKITDPKQEIIKEGTECIVT